MNCVLYSCIKRKTIPTSVKLSDVNWKSAVVWLRHVFYRSNQKPLMAQALKAWKICAIHFYWVTFPFGEIRSWFGVGRETQNESKFFLCLILSQHDLSVKNYGRAGKECIREEEMIEENREKLLSKSFLFLLFTHVVWAWQTTLAACVTTAYWLNDDIYLSWTYSQNH